MQRFAGHAKPSITLDIYVHEFEARKSNDVGERLSTAFSGDALAASPTKTDQTR